MASSEEHDEGGTSASLLFRLKQDDPGAWHRLLDLYTPLAYSWCRRGGLSPEDAADILQETFRSVHAAISTFERQKQGAFRGWLRTVLGNKVRDLHRRWGTQALGQGGTEAYRRINSLPAVSDESAAEMEDGSWRAAIVRRAANLVQGDFEPHTWQAFWLTAVDGLSANEAAARLSMQANAVRQAKFKVLRRLRQELSDLEDL